MPAIITDEFRISNAAQFKQLPATDSIYFSIGQPVAWDNEGMPPVPADDFDTRSYDVYRNFIGAKKLVSGNILHAIKRYDWTSGTIYDRYDDKDSELFRKRFYVYTSARRVYKCIWNNNGATSTVEPTDTSLNATATGDGYVWKYMFDISAEDNDNLVTPDFMPVKVLSADDGSDQWLIQQNAAESNSIHSVEIINAGAGYTTGGGLPTVTIEGDGTGAVVPSDDTHIILDGSGGIAQMLISVPGTGYTFANISFAGGTGADAEVRAVLSPPNGHGTEAYTELGAYYSLTRVVLDNTEDTEGKLVTTNNYRTVSIVRNPIERTSGVPATANFYRNTTVLDLSLLTPGLQFVQDEIIENQRDNLSTAVVVEHDEAAKLLYVTNVKGTFLDGDGILGLSSAVAVNIGPVTPPEFVEYTGNVMYIENRIAINRAPDQTEEIKIIIEH